MGFSKFISRIRRINPKYLLTIIPIITFIYPISIFIFANVNLEWYISMRENIGYLFIATLSIFSLIGWNFQLKASGRDSLFIFPFFIMDLLLFLVVIVLFSSVLTVPEGLDSFWDLSLGIIFLILLKVSADFHFISEVYSDILHRFKSFFESGKRN